MAVCHLWLLPEEAAAQALQERIDWLARRCGTPRFAPHVTLLGRLPGEGGALRRRLALHAARWPAQWVGLEPPATGASYYQNLLLPVRPAPSLLRLRRAVAEVLRVPAAGAWFAHLSLAYGIPARDLPGARAALRAWPLPRRLRLDRLALVAGGATPRDWRLLGSWVLAG